MNPGKPNGLFFGNVLRLVPFLAASLPIAISLAAKHTELEGTASRDAPETASVEFIVVFELQPVNEAVLIVLVVHQCQQRLAIQPCQSRWAKPFTEQGVLFVELLLSGQFFISRKLLITRDNLFSFGVVKHGSETVP